MIYLEETVKEKIKQYREFETQIKIDWGGKKRLFKCVDVQLEIKFSKAEMMFDKSLYQDHPKKKLQMIEMMRRAYKALIDEAKSNGYKALEKDHKCYRYGKDRIAILCDSDLQLSNLKAKYKNDKDTVLFSIEELFRFIPPDYLNAKETFKQKNIDITFEKVTYGKR
jgi:hypothetical protein